MTRGNTQAVFTARSKVAEFDRVTVERDGRANRAVLAHNMVVIESLSAPGASATPPRRLTDWLTFHSQGTDR